VDGSARCARPAARGGFAVDIAGYAIRGKYLHVERPRKGSRAAPRRREPAAPGRWRHVGGCGLVLTMRLGEPIDPRNFHRAFKTRAEKADVAVVPVHATRQTCASLLVALDVHPRVAMAALRHSRIATTMEIYTQVSSTSTGKH
jgi:integrase